MKKCVTFRANHSKCILKMSDTTNISELPIDHPSSGSSGSSGSPSSVSPPSGAGSLDPGTIQQLMSGLKQASISGSTQLPSRDIPMDNNAVHSDPQVVPTYIPPPPSVPDYITSHEQQKDIVNQYQQQQNRVNTLDDMYSEIQMPLLLGVLYFLFQLPFFRKKIYTYLPALFCDDGNYNLNGFLFTSSLFGLFYYLLHALCLNT